MSADQRHLVLVDGQPVVDRRQPGQRYITTRQRAQIIAVYQSGAGTRRIARMTGWSVNAVYSLLRRNGVQMRAPYEPRTTLAQRLDLAARYQAGASVRQLATAAGLAYATVYHVLRSAGVLRPANRRDH